MSRSLLLRPVSVSIILGAVFGIALLSQVTHRISAHHDTKPARLTRAQVADSVSVVSHFCDRVTTEPDWKPAQMMRAESADTIALIGEVCGQLSADTVLLPALLTRDKPVGSGASSIAATIDFKTQ